MSQFIAVLNASDPDLLTNIENAGGTVVSAFEPGVLVVEGDQTVADAVAHMSAVQGVSPVDGAWDISELGLSDDAGFMVSAWNTSLSDQYVAARSDPDRAGEAWEFPGGCDPSGWDDNNGGPMVADNGDGTTGDGTTGTTGDGTTGGGTTGDGSTGTVASTDPPADGGWGDGWDTGGTGSGDGQDGGQQA